MRRQTQHLLTRSAIGRPLLGVSAGRKNTASSVFPPSCSVLGMGAQFGLATHSKAAFCSATRPAFSAEQKTEDPAAAGSQEDPKRTLAQRITELMENFAESRELIADAAEVQGTTYFAEDLQDAVEQTQKTMQMYEDIKASFPTEQERVQFLKENEMKFKQLEKELEVVWHADD